MFCSVCIVILAAAACSALPTLSPRIRNGTEADIIDYPYTANIWELNRISCCAVILSNSWVLTNAWCRENPKLTSFFVQVGSSNSTPKATTGTVHNITKWIYHPLYDKKVDSFALIKVEPRIEYNDYVAPVALPDQDQATPAGAVGVMSGWGSIDWAEGPVDLLHAANFTLKGDKRCATKLGSSYNVRTLCAKSNQPGVAVCWHDEGAPLVVNGTLFGIAFWPDGICAHPEDMQKFGRVASVRDWIEFTMFS